MEEDLLLSPPPQRNFPLIPVKALLNLTTSTISPFRAQVLVYFNNSHFSFFRVHRRGTKK